MLRAIRAHFVLYLLAIAFALTAVVVLGKPHQPALAASDRGISLCETAGMSVARPLGATSLSGAYDTNAKALAHWEVSQGLPEGDARLSGISIETAVTFCYFDGLFDGMPLPPGESTPYTRVGVVVIDGRDPILMVAGRAASLPIAAPGE
jgi:hypothetical protein